MEESERRLRNKGCEAVKIFIDEDDPSLLEFYKKFGYSVEDKTFGMKNF